MKTDLIVRVVAGMALVSLACGSVLAQSATPAVFVSNNGNLEGSVSSFKLGGAGELVFTQKVVTGVRANIGDACPGCNAYEISLSPDGAYIALGHAAGDFDQLSVLRVNADITMTQTGAFAMPTPFDITWIDNELLAVLRTDASPDELYIYRYNRTLNSIAVVEAVNAGTGSSYLLLSADRQYIYANDSSSARVIRGWAIQPDGTLQAVANVSTGSPFALELAISPNGMWVYGACGISGDSHRVLGYSLGPAGVLTQMLLSPFTSPGNSPSNVFVSRDNQYLIVGHGTDATVRMLAINQSDGSLTDTGNMFDVGGQGTLGDVASGPGLMFVTDNSTSSDGLTGLYSFTIGAGGSLTQNGPIVPTTGIAPRSIAVWTPPPPPCAADANGDGHTDSADLSVLLSNFGNAAAGPGFGDFNGDGQCNSADLSVLLGSFGCGT